MKRILKSISSDKHPWHFRLLAWMNGYGKNTMRFAILDESISIDKLGKGIYTAKVICALILGLLFLAMTIVVAGLLGFAALIAYAVFMDWGSAPSDMKMFAIIATSSITLVAMMTLIDFVRGD